MWYEGDNYHLFALRGQLLAMGWARQAGVDLLADSRLADRLVAALRAPALTALPDAPSPPARTRGSGCRWRSRCTSSSGRSDWRASSVPASAAGFMGLAPSAVPDTRAPGSDFRLLSARGRGSPPTAPRTRADLSWWSLLEMATQSA